MLFAIVKVFSVESMSAIGADAVGELCVGTSADIGFNLRPIAFVISDLLAARANGQETAERFNLPGRMLELGKQFLALD